MVYGIFCICHVLVLDQIACGNDYSTLLHHVVLCVDHKMEMTETGFYYNCFHIFVRDISIIMNMMFPFCPLFLLARLFHFP